MAKKRKIEAFLGVVERDGSIFLPWRGTNVYPPGGHNFELGQNLLVELDVTAGLGQFVKAELPTLKQLKQMKDELASDWKYRFTEIFRTASMLQKVLLLRALDNAMRSQDWEK